MKKNNKNNKKPTARIKLTPASVIGVLIGAGIFGIGLYGGIAHEEYSGYFFAGTGLLVMGLVLFISYVKS